MFDLTNELLLKALMFVLVFFITFQVMIKLFKKKSISIVIGLIVSLIAAFYVSPSQMLFLSQTYSVMGSILLISIPIAIAFLFLYSSNIYGGLRKFFWVFYGIMVFLFVRNQDFDNELKTTILLVVIIVLALLLIFDNLIKKKFTFIKETRI